ncbi:MAG: cache domain-containing protein [Acidobacteriota bacterium]
MNPRVVTACVVVFAIGTVMMARGAEPALTPEEQKAEALVREAVELIKAKGEAAFPEFRVKGSKWLSEGHFIFVADDKGLELVNGASTDLEGKNLWDHQDPTGRYVVREEVALVKAKGSGWYDCLWPKPGETEAVPCHSFIHEVTLNDRLLVVGTPIFK